MSNRSSTSPADGKPAGTTSPGNDTPRSSHPVITLAGILLPSSVLHSGWFQALAAFVAVNTLIYAALSLAKLIPRKRA